MYFDALDPKDQKEIKTFTVEIVKEFPIVEDPKNLYPKLSRKFLERFSKSELFPEEFTRWEKAKEKSQFYDDILNYWTIETIIHAMVSMVEDSNVRGKKTENLHEESSSEETERLKISFFDLVAKWAVWAENDPDINSVVDLKRKMKNGKIDNARWYSVYEAIEKGSMTIKKNRNKDLQNNVNFDKRSSKIRSGDLTIGFYSEIDYMINFFFRGMWQVSPRQEKGKKAFGKKWMRETAFKILKGCGYPFDEKDAERKILNFYAMIKDGKRGREEGHLRRTIDSFFSKEYIEMMRFFLAIALYYSPYTTYERFIIQHQEYTGGWQGNREGADGTSEIRQYYIPLYFYEKYGTINPHNVGKTLYISERKQRYIIAYFDEWFFKMAFFWRVYFDSLPELISPQEILRSLNALELPRTTEEEPLWPVEISGGYPLHHSTDRQI